jgi:hypothetical protein
MIKIGVVGHRDLKIESISHYRKQVSNFLQYLLRKYNNVIIYSALADGADRLVVEEGIKLGIEYISILPMHIKMYEIDFDNISIITFHKLLNKSKSVLTLPLVDKNTIENIQIYGKNRDLQYELAGHYISNSCDIMIALWDGNDTGLKGGTSETIKYFCSKSYFTLYHLLVFRENNLKNGKM